MIIRVIICDAYIRKLNTIQKTNITYNTTVFNMHVLFYKMIMRRCLYIASIDSITEKSGSIYYGINNNLSNIRL